MLKSPVISRYDNPLKRRERGGSDDENRPTSVPRVRFFGEYIIHMYIKCVQLRARICRQIAPISPHQTIKCIAFVPALRMFLRITIVALGSEGTPKHGKSNANVIHICITIINRAQSRGTMIRYNRRGERRCRV